MIKTEPGKDAEEDSHKNEGFLKSAWHTLTGQHSPKSSSSPETSDSDSDSNSDSSSAKKDEKKDEKKAPPP
jgi:molecular chaperone DnaJ